MADVCADMGASNATVARVVARSGVSRRTFYEHFVDREDCFLAAFDQTVERIAAAVVPAYREQSKWQEQIRAGLAALLDYLDVERGVARFAIVETLGAGPKALERRASVLAHVVAAIDGGRKEGKAGGDPPPLTAEGLVGGTFSLIHSRLLQDDGGSLVELLNPLMSMIVLPYLGPAAARKELDRLVALSASTTKRAESNPLADLDMRLTYRTVRVLLTIGSRPGASNREVADDSDIRDQGQVSKLLTRLEHLGLIRNAREGDAKGERNMWTLTERGADVREVLISAETRGGVTA